MRDGVLNIWKRNNEYVITFGLTDGRARVMSPHKVHGREGLVGFLGSELHFAAHGVADMMRQIDASGSAHSNVIKMSDDDRFRLGLRDPNENVSSPASCVARRFANSSFAARP